MGDRLVHVEAAEGRVEIALARPERRNAVIGPLVEQLIEAIDAADRDSTTSVILLRGEGGAFCSGLDLKAFNADPAPEWLPSFGARWRALHERLYTCSAPVVGALERFAINGGAALALACDLLVVGEESFLQVGEVQGGMAAPMNVAWLRLRHPESVAAQLCFVGRRFLGPELRSLGIATECVPDDQVLTTARELTERLAGYPEGALRRIKQGIRAYTPDDSKTWFDRATSADPIGTPRPGRVD